MAINRYVLQKQEGHGWELKGFGAQRAVRTFETKAEGWTYVQSMQTPRLVLGRNKFTGQFNEERTYPRSADPRRSVG